MTRRSRALILVTGTIAALTGWSGCRLAAEPAWMALTDRPLDGFHARKLERDALRERYDAKATRLRERARALEVRIAAALTALDAAALAEAMQTYHDWALLLRDEDEIKRLRVLQREGFRPRLTLRRAAATLARHADTIATRGDTEHLITALDRLAALPLQDDALTRKLRADATVFRDRWMRHLTDTARAERDDQPLTAAVRYTRAAEIARALGLDDWAATSQRWADRCLLLARRRYRHTLTVRLFSGPLTPRALHYLNHHPWPPMAGTTPTGPAASTLDLITTRATLTATRGHTTLTPKPGVHIKATTRALTATATLTATLTPNPLPPLATPHHGARTLTHTLTTTLTDTAHPGDRRHKLPPDLSIPPTPDQALDALERQAAQHLASAHLASLQRHHDALLTAARTPSTPHPAEHLLAATLLAPSTPKPAPQADLTPLAAWLHIPTAPSLARRMLR